MDRGDLSLNRHGHVFPLSFDTFVSLFASLQSPPHLSALTIGLQLMSGQSPSRRLRTIQKTMEFFRGVGHGSSQGRQPQKEPSVNLEVPSSDPESSSSKKKITRIQLFGRSRKKSN